MRISITGKFLLLLCVASFSGVSSNVSLALPPLGLTFIDSLGDPLPFPDYPEYIIDLSVIDGSAYVSGVDGVWQTHSDGISSFIGISHSRYGESRGFGLAQVVKAVDGDLYTAGLFRDASGINAGALFQLKNPTAELVTWPTADSISGVDGNLRTLGYDKGLFSAEYHVDGSVVPLGVPPGCQPGVCDSSQFVGQPTEDGYAMGEMAIPGTIGTGPGIFAPDGSARIIGHGVVAGNIVDRSDGGGLNYAIAASSGDYRFQLGNQEIRLTHDSNGNQLVGEANRIRVNQSDFTLISSDVDPGIFAYYPGIVPGSPEVAVPLAEVIPDFASVTGTVTDSYVIGNRIYMSIYDDGDLYLFGALDPSQVPEPSSICCAAILLGMVVFRRC